MATTPATTRNTFVLKGLILQLEEGALNHFRSLSATLNREATCVSYLKGTAFLMPALPEDLQHYMRPGMPMVVKSYIPPSRIVNDTITFANLEVKVSRDPIDGVHLDFTDPRDPCQIAGTREFAALAHNAVLNSCGEARPSPCESCLCPGRSKTIAQAETGRSPVCG